MNINEAISHKRIHHQWMPDITYLEEGVLSGDLKLLYENMGHKTEMVNRFGDEMGIVVDKKNNTLYGACDPHSRDGLAIGY